jgi:hypothetical protein
MGDFIGRLLWEFAEVLVFATGKILLRWFGFDPPQDGWKKERDRPEDGVHEYLRSELGQHIVCGISGIDECQSCVRAMPPELIHEKLEIGKCSATLGLSIWLFDLFSGWDLSLISFRIMSSRKALLPVSLSRSI